MINPALVAYKENYDSSTRILTYKMLPKEGGFISTYCYDIELYNYHRLNGCSVKGFAATKPVCHSDVVLLDFDDCKDEARKFYTFIKERGYTFRVYDSGNRSIHFHIKRDYIASSLLPKMDKAWVSKYAPKADLSLYSSMHFYRLPNTIHSGTGKKKVLIEEVIGNNTVIDYPEISTETFRYEDRLLSPSDLFNDGFITNSIWGFHNGNRDNNMFKLIKRLSEFGGREFVEVFVRAVNAQSDPPLDNERIEYMLDYHLGEGND